jgi:hypothetical protein
MHFGGARSFQLGRTSALKIGGLFKVLVAQLCEGALGVRVECDLGLRIAVLGKNHNSWMVGMQKGAPAFSEESHPHLGACPPN